MPQFDVYKNKNPISSKLYPYLIDVQANLLGDLQTRVVIPLAKAPPLRKTPITNLTPVLEIHGESFTLLTPQLAGISKADLGTAVTNLSERRDLIIGALDFLLTGI